MISRSEQPLWVVARYNDGNDTDIPDAYLQVWGPFSRWVQGINSHCRFDYDTCYHYFTRCTTPGDTMYYSKPCRITGFIAPIREETTAHD